MVRNKTDTVDSVWIENEILRKEVETNGEINVYRWYPPF